MNDFNREARRAWRTMQEIRHQEDLDHARTRKLLPAAIAIIGPLGLAILFFIILGIRSCAHADTVQDTFRIRAINSAIGEAEGEGLAGMRAIISCLRNRGQIMHKPFKGVYGEHAQRVLRHLYGEKTFVLAVRAFEDSAKHDYSNGATGWGNAKDIATFAKHKWWKRCTIVAHIGRHFFYKEADDNRNMQNQINHDIDRGL